MYIHVIYTLHASQVVLNHVTYYMNLTKANSEDRVDWIQEYSAKVPSVLSRSSVEYLYSSLLCSQDAYEMKASRPEDWNQLIQKFESDDKLFQKFYQ